MSSHRQWHRGLRKAMLLLCPSRDLRCAFAAAHVPSMRHCRRERQSCKSFMYMHADHGKRRTKPFLIWPRGTGDYALCNIPEPLPYDLVSRDKRSPQFHDCGRSLNRVQRVQFSTLLDDERLPNSAEKEHRSVLGRLETVLFRYVITLSAASTTTIDTTFQLSSTSTTSAVFPLLFASTCHRPRHLHPPVVRLHHIWQSEEGIQRSK
jgi:hypothetical protein